MGKLKKLEETTVETQEMRYIYTVLAYKNKKPQQYRYLDLNSSVPSDQLDDILERAKFEKHNKLVDSLNINKSLNLRLFSFSQKSFFIFT